jgi:hypothetical protein
MADGTAGLRRNGMWGAAAFGVALAVVIGVRLEQAALAVLVGVVCGVGASIPTSLLIVSIMRRQDQRTYEQRRRSTYQAQPQPPVIVVTPSSAPQLPQPMNWSAPAPAQRQFTVIGEEEMNNGLDYYQE